MKLTDCTPQQLCLDLLKRSTAKVQVAAVLVDDYGIFSWGWNSSGPDGLGQHAEIHALVRANLRRLSGSTIYVAGRRKKSKNPVCAKPCTECQEMLDKFAVAHVYWRGKDGLWAA